ncbi:MAG: glycosyltransferase family 39 protein [Candidatus Alcyoniella australis]|nr:glycosyltransferase family 39 protein [Candidatus Alcyoniella australis]
MAALLLIWSASCLFYLRRFAFVMTDMTMEHTTQVAGLWHLAHSFTGNDRLSALLQVGSYYPRLPGLLGLAALSLFEPESIWSLRALSLAWTALGAVALYLLTRDRAGGMAGIAAATLWLSMPLVLCEARAYTWQTQMTACGAWSLLLFSRSRGFTRPGLAALGGVCGALCLLSVRGLPYLLLAPPAVALALQALVQARREGRVGRASAGMLIGGALCLLPALPFTLKYLLTWGHRLGWQTFGQYPQGETQGASAPLFYISGFFTHGAGPLLGTAIVLGLIAALAFRRLRDPWIWVWALLPILALSTFGTKMVIYMVVALPAFAVLAALGAAALPRPRLRNVALLTLTGCALLSLGWYNFAAPALSPVDPSQPAPELQRRANLYEIANYALAGDPTPARQMLSLLEQSQPTAVALLAGSGDDVGFGGLAVELQYAHPALPLMILYPFVDLYPRELGRMWVVRSSEANQPAGRQIAQLGRCLDRLKIRVYKVEQVQQVLRFLFSLPVEPLGSVRLGPARFELPVVALAPHAQPSDSTRLIWPCKRASICLAGGRIVER